MMNPSKSRTKAEYGDFQTPEILANEVCDLLIRLGCAPQSIIEPTCGVGHFLCAALQSFPSLKYLTGIEINSEYVYVAKQAVDALATNRPDVTIDISVANFFVTDWATCLATLPDPLLIIGNPPWITNAEIGTLNGDNLPPKRNFQKLSGLDALTGASNFDISEWMLLQTLDWLKNRTGTIAMLCKTSVARKVLYATWKNSHIDARFRLYRIDSQSNFGVTVDACLLVVDKRITNGENNVQTNCQVFKSLTEPEPSELIGYRQGILVSNIDLFEKWYHLLSSPATNQEYTWRSGIKHDASPIMELQKTGSGYKNRLDESTSLEGEYLYPMLKGSDIAGDSTREPRFWMLVPQKKTGEDTASIQVTAPRTWQYLMNHAQILDSRKSSIYRNRPRFSIFGVGDYTFASWKVVIAGMYKDTRFHVIGEHKKQPIVLDDTCYFLSFSTQEEAEFIANLLNSDIAQQFYRAFIFWDEKRPVTVGLLRKLNISALAAELGVGDKLAAFVSHDYQGTGHTQLQLLEKRMNYQSKGR